MDLKSGEDKWYMDSTVNTKLQMKSPEMHTVMKRQYAAEVPELYNSSL